MTQSTLANTMNVYPVEFYRQSPASTANRVYMTPCKFNAGVITMAARTDYIQNGSFRDTNYWTASGGSFSVTMGKRGVVGYYAARFNCTSVQGTLTTDLINLGSAFSTTASVYVTSNVDTVVSIKILGTDSGGTVLDTATSGNISISANLTTRINVASAFAGSNYRKVQLVVGDGSTTQNGVEVYWDEAGLENGTRTAIDYFDESSSGTAVSNTAGSLIYDLTSGNGSSIQLPTPISGTFWTRVGASAQTGASGAGTLFNISGVGSIAMTYTKSTSTLSMVASGGTINVTSLTLTPNDLLWVGWYISKTNVKLYYSVNGGAVVTAQTGANASPSATFSTLYLGHDSSTLNHWEAPIEEFLLWETVLSDAEFTALAAKTTPTNMDDDSRIQFAAVTTDQQNQFYMCYIKATNLSGRWNGSWRNADIRPRITNNKTNTGKAVNYAEISNVQRETFWDKSGGSSSYKQYRVWNQAFIGKGTEWYHSQFYCTNTDHPSWSLYEAFQVLDIPGSQPTILVNKRWGSGSKDRDAYYMSEQTLMKPYPAEARTYGYVQ